MLIIILLRTILIFLFSQGVYKEKIEIKKSNLFIKICSLVHLFVFIWDNSLGLQNLQYPFTYNCIFFEIIVIIKLAAYVKNKWVGLYLVNKD